MEARLNEQADVFLLRTRDLIVYNVRERSDHRLNGTGSKIMRSDYRDDGNRL